MKCIDSRPQPDGTRLRTYRTAQGRRVQTIELPLAVFTGVVLGDRFTRRMAGWHRGEALRERQARAQVLIDAGVKPLAIAHEVGLTPRSIQRRKENNARK